MVLLIAAFILSVGLTIALIHSVENSPSRRWLAERTGTTLSTDHSDRLPAGADAALWSIVEAVPDPRNHLALTRDLTGEVRIAGTLLDPEFRASTVTPPPRPVPAGGSSVRIIPAPSSATIDAIEAEHAERDSARDSRTERAS